jgi:hemoglobin/transferrin/lactoferrin receptor protein
MITKKYKSLILITLCAISAYAQQEEKDSLTNYHFEEVVISVNKEEELKKNVAQQVQVISIQQIQMTQGMTTADVLSGMGVQMQRSQQGGGSPMLRGFEASRILLVIDGVRMNNLIFRAGHLQDLIKTDNNSLERIELLYGPSSTVYGSDALGGVVHLYSQRPKFGSDEKVNIGGNALIRYESANKGLTANFNFNYGTQKIASFTSLSFSESGDLISGKNQNPFYVSSYGERPYYAQYLGNGRDTVIQNSNRFLQVGSGYTQLDIIQKIICRQNDFLQHDVNFQFSNSGNVPRYDRMTETSASTVLRYGEWYYGPQSRMLLAYNANYRKPNSFFDLIHLGLNYQIMEESRYSRNFNSRYRSERIENVDVIGIQLDFRKKLDAHEVRFGYDSQLNFLKSKAKRHDIVADTSGKLSTRYPDGKNNMNSFAIYASHTWKINEVICMVDGLRFGYTYLNSTLKDTDLFNLPYSDINQKTPVYSGNFGLIATPGEDLKLSAIVSTGFRVPNVDDLTKIFDSSPGRVIVPNARLRPEKTVNYELGIAKIFNNKVSIENALYYTDFFDIAVVDAFSFNGQDSILYDGTMSRVYANQNKDEAYILGFSSQLNAKLTEHFSMRAMLNYQYGRVKTDSSDVPLDHIAPLLARLSFNYTHDRFSSDMFVLYNAAKKLKDYSNSGEDNLQYATSDGIPAWVSVNLRFSYKVYKYIVLQVGVDNLFDTQYRTFASGINAPGRNFIVALRGIF